MDDSIFVDLVNALLTYEKDDKEKEAPKKGNVFYKDKENKDSDKDKKGDSNDDSSTPFPSMQIFSVSERREKNYIYKTIKRGGGFRIKLKKNNAHL